MPYKHKSHTNLIDSNLFDLEKGQIFIINKIGSNLLKNLIYEQYDTINAKISSKHDNMHNNDIINKLFSGYNV